MLARALAGLFPDLGAEEALEVASLYSLRGRLSDRPATSLRPPFRAPHHSVSRAGLIGGGAGIAQPGEVSLAHARMRECPQPDRPERFLSRNRGRQFCGAFTEGWVRGRLRAPGTRPHHAEPADHRHHRIEKEHIEAGVQRQSRGNAVYIARPACREDTVTCVNSLEEDQSHGCERHSEAGGRGEGPANPQQVADYEHPKNQSGQGHQPSVGTLRETPCVVDGGLPATLKASEAGRRQKRKEDGPEHHHHAKQTDSSPQDAHRIPSRVHIKSVPVLAAAAEDRHHSVRS